MRSRRVWWTSGGYDGASAVAVRAEIVAQLAVRGWFVAVVSPAVSMPTIPPAVVHCWHLARAAMWLPTLLDRGVPDAALVLSPRFRDVPSVAAASTHAEVAARRLLRTQQAFTLSRSTLLLPESDAELAALRRAFPMAASAVTILPPVRANEPADICRVADTLAAVYEAAGSQVWEASTPAAYRSHLEAALHDEYLSNADPDAMIMSLESEVKWLRRAIADGAAWRAAREARAEADGLRADYGRQVEASDHDRETWRRDRDALILALAAAQQATEQATAEVIALREAQRKLDAERLAEDGVGQIIPQNPTPLPTRGKTRILVHAAGGCLRQVIPSRARRVRA